MAIPQGYSPLAKIGIVDKGAYVQGTAYSQLDAVYYDGSTYLALIDSPVGIPTNDGVNWRYLARGMYAQTIENYNDLMANEVGGYLPDALAVKEGFNSINGSLKNLTQLSGVSLLSVQEQGRYYIANPTDPLEGENGGYLEVSSTSLNYAYRTIEWTPNTKSYKYINTCANGTWSGWQRVALKSDLPISNSNYGNAIKLIHFQWNGTVIAGQTVDFGSFQELVPSAYDFIGMILTPRGTVHLSMSYHNYHVYGYSETFSGEIRYDAFMILAPK